MEKMELFVIAIMNWFKVLDSSNQIASIALLISVAVFIWQIISSSRNSKNIKETNEKALSASIEANKTSERIYKIEKEYNELNYKKGEFILSFIIYRYFFAFYNLFENQTTNKPTIKKDKVSHRQFIQECRLIESDLFKLIENPNYIKLLEARPSLSKLRQVLSFDIVDLEHKSENDIDFEINYSTYFFFQDLYYLLKEEYSSSELWKSGFFEDIEKGFDIIKVERPGNIPKKFI